MGAFSLIVVINLLNRLMKKANFLKELENDLRKAKNKGDAVKEVEVLCEIGENLFTDNRYDDSLSRFDRIVEICSSKKHPKLEDFHLDGLRRSIDCLIEVDLLDEALARADAYVKLSRELHQEPHVQQALLNKARVAMHLSEKPHLADSEKSELHGIAERMFLGSENSLYQMKKAGVSEIELEIPRKRASLYQNMTQFFNNINEVDKAKEYMKRGIEVAAKNSDLLDILLLIYAEAQAIYEKEQSFQVCVQYGQRSLNILEKIKEKEEETFNTVFQLSKFFCALNDLEKAYKTLKKVLKPKKSEKFESFPEAMLLAKKLKQSQNLEWNLEKSDVEDIAENCEELGDLYAGVSAYQLSIEKYEHALDILKQDSLFSNKMYEISLSICLNLCDMKQFEAAADKYLFITSNLENQFCEVGNKGKKRNKMYR